MAVHASTEALPAGTEGGQQQETAAAPTPMATHASTAALPAGAEGGQQRETAAAPAPMAAHASTEGGQQEKGEAQGKGVQGKRVQGQAGGSRKRRKADGPRHPTGRKQGDMNMVPELQRQ